MMGMIVKHAMNYKKKQLRKSMSSKLIERDERWRNHPSKQMIDKEEVKEYNNKSMMAENNNIIENDKEVYRKSSYIPRKRNGNHFHTNMSFLSNTSKLYNDSIDLMNRNNYGNSNRNMNYKDSYSYSNMSMNEANSYKLKKVESVRNFNEKQDSSFLQYNQEFEGEIINQEQKLFNHKLKNNNNSIKKFAISKLSTSSSQCNINSTATTNSYNMLEVYNQVYGKLPSKDLQLKKKTYSNSSNSFANRRDSKNEGKSSNSTFHEGQKYDENERKNSKRIMSTTSEQCYSKRTNNPRILSRNNKSNCFKQKDKEFMIDMRNDMIFENAEELHFMFVQAHQKQKCYWEKVSSQSSNDLYPQLN